LVEEAMKGVHRSSGSLSAALIAGLLIMSVERTSADSVKLTGCLVKGEDSDSGYLLVNAPLEPGTTRSENRSVTPGTVGTTGLVANTFYWLDNDDDLKPHVGHRVEIEGDLKGDVKDGEMKIDRKDQWTEIEVKSDGREIEARIPNASIIGGSDADRKIDVLVRRVDVEKVRMLDAACR
jgi:hypothetical protein